MKNTLVVVVNLLKLLVLVYCHIYYEINKKPDEVLKLNDCEKGKKSHVLFQTVHDRMAYSLIRVILK